MLRRLWELARLFAKLGTISFGGPAVSVAMMEEEVVERRGWMTHQGFLDLVGATYLIPGPNAVEMANHVGYCRAGVLGSLAAGLSFSLPAVLISGALAFSYVQYGELPQVEPLFCGIKPVVLALIVAAVWRLGRKGLRTWQTGTVAVGVAAASLAGYNDVLALLVGTVLGVLVMRLTQKGSGPGGKAGAALGASLLGSGTAQAAATTGVLAATGGAAAASAASVSVWKLGLFFLEVGLVFYGGGYVLVAYMEGGLVSDYGWMTRNQLVDAVAIGQMTPGPMLSTVTFVGYVLAGVPGAVVSTVAILLPSFVLVAAINPWIPRLRRSRWASLFLDAVSAAAIGLMAAVVVTLYSTTMVGWPSWLIALAAGLLALWPNVAPIWLVIGGGAAGYLLFPPV